MKITCILTFEVKAPEALAQRFSHFKKWSVVDKYAAEDKFYDKFEKRYTLAIVTAPKKNKPQTVLVSKEIAFDGKSAFYISLCDVTYVYDSSKDQIYCKTLEQKI